MVTAGVPPRSSRSSGWVKAVRPVRGNPIRGGRANDRRGVRGAENCDARRRAALPLHQEAGCSRDGQSPKFNAPRTDGGLRCDCLRSRDQRGALARPESEVQKLRRALPLIRPKRKVSDSSPCFTAGLQVAQRRICPPGRDGDGHSSIKGSAANASQTVCSYRSQPDSHFGEDSQKGAQVRTPVTMADFPGPPTWDCIRARRAALAHGDRRLSLGRLGLEQVDLVRDFLECPAFGGAYRHRLFPRETARGEDDLRSLGCSHRSSNHPLPRDSVKPDGSRACGRSRDRTTNPLVNRLAGGDLQASAGQVPSVRRRLAGLAETWRIPPS